MEYKYEILTVSEINFVSKHPEGLK